MTSKLTDLNGEAIWYNVSAGDYEYSAVWLGFIREGVLFVEKDRRVAMARRWNIPSSTLWEWIKILDLNAKMRDVVAKELITFSDGVAVAKLKLGEDLQDKLAETVETQGLEAFKKELDRVKARKMKRGIPAGVYEIDRVVWDKRNRKEISYYEILTRAAEKREIKVPEYIKDFLIRHIDEIEGEA